MSYSFGGNMGGSSLPDFSQLDLSGIGASIAKYEAEEAKKGATNQYEADFQRELDAREALADGGIVWGEDFSNEDREAFVSVVTEIWEELAEEAGGNAPAYRERVLIALGR